MHHAKPSRWRRVAEHRRAATRRMLAGGALLGLVGGLLAQFVVQGHVEAELVPMVRVALILPAVLFVGWWLVFPGISLERDVLAPVTEGSTLDVDQRLERIEQAFDAAAVPSARRRLPAAGDADVAAMFRASIRRAEATSDAEHARFGVRRPDTHFGENEVAR